MKLQISFDITNLEKAIDIAKRVEQYADTFEIGTLLLYRYGIEAVEKFRVHFSNKQLLVDTKIIEQGKDTVTLFSSYGINWITIMAGAPKDMIHTVCSAAQSAKMSVMLDILDSNVAGQSAMEADQMGVNQLLVHRPYDEKDFMGFMEKWEMIRGNTPLPIFISGKINRDNIASLLPLQPDGIVIGSAIVKSENPAKEAEFFSRATKEIINL